MEWKAPTVPAAVNPPKGSFLLLTPLKQFGKAEKMIGWSQKTCLNINAHGAREKVLRNMYRYYRLIIAPLLLFAFFADGQIHVDTLSTEGGILLTDNVQDVVEIRIWRSRHARACIWIRSAWAAIGATIWEEPWPKMAEWRYFNMAHRALLACWEREDCPLITPN